MVAVVAAALTAATPHLSEPLWLPVHTPRRGGRSWRATVDDTAAALTLAVGWRHAVLAADPSGPMPPSAQEATASAAVAAYTATTASDVMREAAGRVTAYPLLVAGSPARAGSVRSVDSTLAGWSTPFSVFPPVAATRAGTPDLRLPLTTLSAAVPGGLRPATLMTAVALLHRHQSVDPAGAVFTPHTAGRLVAAALLAARHSPGVPPVPVAAVTAVPGLGVADGAAAGRLEALLVGRLGNRGGVVVSAAEQEATAWMLVWRWGGEAP